MSSSDEDAADVEREREYWLAQLSSIPARRAQLEEDERETVRQARLADISWHEIATALNLSAWWQARDKYGEPDGDPF